MRLLTPTLCLLSCLSSAASAQRDADREAEMFGEPTDEREAGIFDEPSKKYSPQQSSTSPTGGLLGFGGLGADALAIGGRLLSRLESTLQEDTALAEQPLRAPNLFDLYIDGRPSDRLRVYLRGRVLYTPTAGGGSQSTSDGSVDPLSFLGGQQVTRQLDQLWMKFDIERAAFVTVGAQPVRWGTGRIWNPTDFVNQNFRDPLALADLRTGVGAAKLHVPLVGGTVNLYALALFDGADTLGDVGGAFRVEAAVDTAEVALSVATGRGQPARVGADLSAGVGPLELRGEVALSTRERRATPDALTLAFVEPWLEALPSATAPLDHPFLRASTGFEWEIGYGEDGAETAFVGAEYFYNQAGVTDRAAYPALLLTGNYQPFYLGEHYGAAFVLLPSPGDWEDTSLFLTAIANLSDRSGVVRLNTTFTVLDKLSVQPFVSGRFGPKGGEFRLALDLPEAGSTPAVSTPAPLADVGVWASLSF